MKVLFMAPYPVLEPVTRFRIVQYFRYYREIGIQPVLSPFLSERAYLIKNKVGILATLEKVLWVLLSCVRRCCELVLLRKYDIVYISKEAFPFGPPFLESMIKRICPNLVYDFDDAVFAYPDAPGVFRWRRLWEDRDRVAKVIALSSMVIVGNRFLASYASGYNREVHVIPTPIDTKKYCPRCAQGL